MQNRKTAKRGGLDFRGGGGGLIGVDKNVQKPPFYFFHKGFFFLFSMLAFLFVQCCFYLGVKECCKLFTLSQTCVIAIVFDSLSV